MESIEKIRKRVVSEYKKIAFAPIGGEVKVTDKLRALDAYWTLVSGDQFVPDDGRMVIIREYVQP